MIDPNSGEVDVAFQILLDQMEAQLDFVSNLGARAFESRDYGVAHEAEVQAKQMTALRDRAADLRSEWSELWPQTEQRDSGISSRRDLGHLQRGERTRESDCFIPILTTLIEQGGSVKVTDLMPSLEVKMRHILREVDYEPVVSRPNETRWVNVAHWARDKMVKKGLLKGNSPRGTWEITEAGRAFVRNESRMPP